MNPFLERWLIYFSGIGALGVWALVLMYLERRDVRNLRRH